MNKAGCRVAWHATKNAIGFDDISSRLLSITIETVPSFLKKIKVIPLFCLTHDLAVWAGQSIRLSIKFLNSKQFLVADT